MYIVVNVMCACNVLLLLLLVDYNHTHLPNNVIIVHTNNSVVEKTIMLLGQYSCEHLQSSIVSMHGYYHLATYFGGLGGANIFLCTSDLHYQI